MKKKDDASGEEISCNARVTVKIIVHRNQDAFSDNDPCNPFAFDSVLKAQSIRYSVFIDSIIHNIM